ncbi:Rha family transcriptional regulator [Listeria goaensis]|uniref:Rha family transcriptional regulator n=1 Tax=Listeria goaensis TaxID=1649188 RepID=UPI000B594975|nr:phage antirepressor KilAC domain-containing protein [Listeria goaensis]
MSELVIMKNQEAVTSSLIVAEGFEKRHDNILRDIQALREDVLNFEEMFFETAEPDTYGRERKVIYMNRDGFTLLAMGFTGKKALQFKLKYIEAFNQMEQHIKQNNFQIPQTRAEALRLAADLEEENQLLKLKNTEMQPKALFADAVKGSHTSILVGELAKLINQNGVEIGQNRLFKWLRKNGYLIAKKSESYNMPTQKSMDLDIMEIKERSIVNGDGSTRITRTPKVTGKGQIYFINKFISESQLVLV